MTNLAGKHMGRHTQGFGSTGDAGQVRQVGRVGHRVTGMNDVSADETAMFQNHEDSHRAVRRGGDKFGVHRHSQMDGSASRTNFDS